MRHVRIDPGRELATRDEGDITVMEWMSIPPLVIRPEVPVEEAGRLMRTHHIRHLPVVDQRQRLVGIVSERDLRRIVGGLVSHAMTRGLFTVRPETALADAARTMHAEKIGALPVVVEDRVVGILTRTDINRAFVHLVADTVRFPRKKSP